MNMRNLILLTAFTLALVCGGTTGFVGAQTQPPDVRLPLDRYDVLMKQAQSKLGAVVAWSPAEVTATLLDEGQVVEVRLVASFQAYSDGLVPLLPAEVALKQSLVGSNAASLVRHSGMLALSVSQDQTSDVDIRYQVPVSHSPRGNTVILPMLPTPGAELTVSIDDGTAEIWPAASISMSGTVARASVPSTSAVAVRWGIGDGDARVRRLDYKLSVDTTSEGVDVAATFEVDVVGQDAMVRLAKDSVPLVEVDEKGKPLSVMVQDGWHHVLVTGPGRHVVTATLRPAVDRSQGQPRLELFGGVSPITRVELTVGGVRTVHFTPPVPVSTETQGEGDQATTRSVAFLPPSELVFVQWTESQAPPEEMVRFNTETFQFVALQEGVVRAKTEIRYEVIRGKVRELVVQVPEDVVLYRVAGDSIEDWRTFAATAETPRHVKITLGKEIEGQYGLSLELEAVVPKAEGTELVVPTLRPLESFRETGVIALFDGDKVGFAPAEQTQFTKVGQDAIPSDLRQTLTETVGQAYKHIGPPGELRVKITTAKPKDVRYDARILSLYSAKEGVLGLNVSAVVEIKSGRTDELVFSLPDNVTVLDLSAPNLNKAEAAKDMDVGEGRKGHVVRFTQALEGTVQIDLEVESLLPKQLGVVRLPDVHLLGAEVEEGSLGIVADTGIEVQQGGLNDLRRVDVAELPNAIRLRSPKEPVLGYQYTHPSWQLDLTIKRHETVETLKAVAAPVWFESIILEDGHIITQAVFDVSNEDRQFLRLSLPDENKVWSVTADGVGVKAVTDETGALAVPLTKGAKSRVEVVFEQRIAELGTVGTVELTAPKADILLTDIQWMVVTPSSLALLGVVTKLKASEPYSFSMDRSRASQGGVTIPRPGQVAESVYLSTVVDPTENAPVIRFRYVKAPGQVLLVLFGVWMALLAGVFTRKNLWVFKLVGGVIAVVLAAGLFSTGKGEGALGITALAVAVVVGLRIWRWTKGWRTP
ncbi:MAG: hypothetical protein HUU55_09410 [Myxococcales bacterium]|nr:hypothetical protein [Myxococcales bacterium]